MLKAVIALLIFLSSLVYADDRISDPDEKVQAVLEEAEQLFKQRSISNPDFLGMILKKLAAAENKAEDPCLNYNVYVLESKILYWKAKYVLGLLDIPRQRVKPETIYVFNLGKAKAEAAIQIAGCDGFAEAHYYAGLHLAGIARVLLATNAPWEEWKFYEEAAQKKLKETRGCTAYFDNAPGDMIDGWGISREFASMQLRCHFDPGYYLLWSYKEALKEAKIAYTNAKNYAENVTTYAETLMQGEKYEKFLATAILNAMLSQDPRTYNPDRIEETMVQFQKARDILRHYPWSTPISYKTAKEGFNDYREATKLQTEVSNRIISNESKLNGLNAERLSWFEIQKQQEKIFSSFDLLRSSIEEATPVLVVKIQTYLASQQDSLQALLDDVYRLIRETQDLKVRDALQFEIMVLSDLSAVKRNLGDSPEALKKTMDLAVHGDKEERAKALGFFDPLTQAILKWVFEVTPPLKENIFSQVKQEVIQLQVFSKEHLSTIESEIQFTTQNLQYAKDDEKIAEHVVKTIYDACQAASLL